MHKLRVVGGTGLVALAIILVGCSEQKLGGEVEVNGQKTNVASCLVSPPGGEKWVVVSADNGLRIRILQRAGTANGSSTKTETIVQVGQPRSPSFADAQCQSKFTTSSSIDGRVSGSVTLSNCRAASATVSGEFTYGQCSQPEV